MTLSPGDRTASPTTRALRRDTVTNSARTPKRQQRSSCRGCSGHGRPRTETPDLSPATEAKLRPIIHECRRLVRRSWIGSMPRLDNDDYAPIGALTISGFCRVYNVGRTFVYSEIAEGRLEARKAGSR